ncbi:MAG: hypothetical protein IPJ15_10260 [Actinomycetales bacterium]|nr:hypothetical protein [Candidatus Phosphoribacter baldrii]
MVDQSCTYLLCWENLRVSGFLGVFSAFYFAITSASDATLRTSLYDSAQDLVRQACAVRTYLLARPADGSPSPGVRELTHDVAEDDRGHERYRAPPGGRSRHTAAVRRPSLR